MKLILRQGTLGDYDGIDGQLNTQFRGYELPRMPLCWYEYSIGQDNADLSSFEDKLSKDLYEQDEACGWLDLYDSHGKTKYKKIFRIKSIGTATTVLLSRAVIFANLFVVFLIC